MIISHSKKFIMLAPWKTASQTCHASLERYNQSPYSRSFHFNPYLGRVVHQHATLSDLRAMPEGSLGYKLAAFVRNPYDRAYSGFLQLRRDFESQPREQFEPSWIGDLVREQISQNMKRIIAAGFDFDNWFAALPDYEIYCTGRNTNMPLQPAHYWTHLNGEQVVDFLGRVETFDLDFAAFCKFMDLDQPKINSQNVSVGERSRSKDFSRYALNMSRRTIDRINSLFSRDFDLFGYTKL